MIRIGVIGQSGPIAPELLKLSLELGKEIAMQGAILFTGGTTGIMEAVSRGAQEAGGTVVGILPGDGLDLANDYIDIPISTGLSFDYRSLILVHSSDAIIMVGGGNGTLGELSAAYMHQKPLIVLESSGGWAGKVREAAYGGCYLDERKTTRIEYTDSPAEAAEIAFRLASQRQEK
ncbi:MAG TPA: TIGR00725 family protein [Syntrophomonadaceae bacterium]|nr:TIGR00725 family protein [Syntrophomonadaceae bacterium]